MYKVYVEFTRPDPTKKKFPILSWLIRAAQKTTYSHVRLRWLSRGSQEPIIYEASGTHVKVIGSEAVDQFPVKVVHSFEVTVNSEEYRKLIKLLRYSSLSYGVSQILGIAIALIFKLKKNPLSRGRSFQVCSELLGLFASEVKGWDLSLDLDLAGPKEIHSALTKLVEDGTLDIRLVN